MSRQPFYFILVRAKLIQSTSLHLLHAINLCPCSLMGQHGSSGLDSRLTNTTETYNTEQCSMPYHTVKINHCKKKKEKIITVLQHSRLSPALICSKFHFQDIRINYILHINTKH